jgi:hypothetical protein
MTVVYIVQNWSFEQRWDTGAEAYADTMLENLSDLVLDESGITERFSGVQIQVPWSQVHDYALYEDRLFIHFLKHQSFIVPFRDLSANQRDQLMATLENHNVRKRA